MTKHKLEYIWLDGYQPTQSLRSKTKVVSDFSGKVEDAPMWCFDGSSTEQAPGGSSDCLLKPVACFPDPGRKNGFLVMTEVMNPDGTPHRTNGRATIDDDDDDFWFGFEQEYTIWNPDTDRPIGFPAVIEAGLRVGKLGNSSVRYEVGIFTAGDDALAAHGHFVHVYVTRADNRPTPIPMPIRTALEPLVVA